MTDIAQRKRRAATAALELLAFRHRMRLTADFEAMLQYERQVAAMIQFEGLLAQMREQVAAFHAKPRRACRACVFVAAVVHGNGAAGCVT